MHTSNIHRPEAFRHPSYVSRPASGVIAGFGAQGHVLAPHRLAALLGSRAP